MRVEEIDLGELVYCDGCSKDYTASNALGGLLFGSYGYCPECAPRIAASAEKYGETWNINDRAREGESFCDFVLRIRGGNNKIVISGGDDAVDELTGLFKDRFGPRPKGR